MQGFITKRHLANAEIEFPGITALYERLTEKPKTFLCLLKAWEKECACCLK